MTKSCLNIIWVVNCGQTVFGLVFFIIFTVPVKVRTICGFDNLEKLSTLLEFLRNILEGWARVVVYSYFY